MDGTGWTGSLLVGKRDRWARGEGVEFAEFYIDLSVVRERDRFELGGRSDDRPPQTLRAFGRQELPPSPSLSLPERSGKTYRSFETFSPGPSIPL